MSENLSQSSKNREKIMAVSTGGICLALAEVLSILKLYEMPQGGSVTLASMLPIILYGLCFGPVWGIGAALIYSVMQLMIGGYILAPGQVMLDYILAFTSLGAAGLFAAKPSLRLAETNILRRLRLIPYWKILLATGAAMLGRLVFSFLSGIVFYASYAPEGQAVWIYSLAYNGTYLIPEFVITLSALAVLLETLRFHPRVQDTNTMSLAEWLLAFILSAVPVFGQVMLVVWAFDVNTKASKKTWAQAMLIVIGVLACVWLIYYVVHGNHFAALA